MRKEELLDKLNDLIANFEEKGAYEIYPGVIKMVDEAGFQEDKKTQCKEIIQKLIDDSIVHIEILKELTGTVSAGEKDDF